MAWSKRQVENSRQADSDRYAPSKKHTAALDLWRQLAAVIGEAEFYHQLDNLPKERRYDLGYLGRWLDEFECTCQPTSDLVCPACYRKLDKEEIPY